MTYTKPEVAVLGAAVSVIESHIKVNTLSTDGTFPQSGLNPAYDLDE